MRKIGYALLFIGFAWICMQQLQGVMRGGLRPIVLAQYEKLAPEKVYSAADVQQHIRETAVATFDAFPRVIVPGIFMLVGGLLLARKGRAQNGKSGA